MHTHEESIMTTEQALAPHLTSTTHVAVERKHFIGTGRNAWLITGRVCGDDDDTAYLVLADDEAIAQETFKRELRDCEVLQNDAPNADDLPEIYIIQSDMLS
nr:hypothetical protein [Pseudomonas aeruginosa]